MSLNMFVEAIERILRLD